MKDSKTTFDPRLRLLAVLQSLGDAWEGMPVSVAALFVKIAHHDQLNDLLTITGAGEMVGMKLASTSRNIQLLENRIGERGSEPVALVEIKAHPSDYRRKVVSLTPKGRDLYKRLCSLVGES